MAWFPIFVGSCWASFCFQWPENFTYSHDIPTTDASIGIYVPTSIHCRSFYQTNFKCHYCLELRNLLPNKVNDKFVFASFDSDPPPPPKLIYSEFLYYNTGCPIWEIVNTGCLINSENCLHSCEIRAISFPPSPFLYGHQQTIILTGNSLVYLKLLWFGFAHSAICTSNWKQWMYVMWMRVNNTDFFFMHSKISKSRMVAI